MTINRSKAFENMSKGIYGNQNVNYTKQEVKINDNGIKSYLYKPQSMARLRQLLEVTFKDTHVQFGNKNNGISLDKEKVRDNTVKYLRGLGINLPEIVNPTEKKLLDKWMCNVILEYIVPAIFSNVNIEKGKIDIENDDISSEFNKAVDGIKSKFCSGDFFEQLYVDIKSSDIEKISDSEYSENECNFGVLVCSAFEQIFDRFNFVPTISYYSGNDNKQPTDPSKKVDKQFAELTSKLVSSMNLDNKNFVSPYYYIENSNSVTGNKAMEYTIGFNIDAPNSSFIPRYFYFMTKIDDRIIDERYSSCESADTLNQKLIEKAVRQIRLKYTNEITEYYQQCLANIELLCSKFLAINVEGILSQQIRSIEGFKKVLKSLCNKDDIDEVWSICKGNDLADHQAIRYIYCGIETTIQDFLYMISDSMIMNEDKPLFFHAIEDYIPKSSIAKHTNVLSTLLKKSKIDELSNLRVKYNIFNWNSNVGLKMYYRNDANTLPMHDKREDVYSCLKNTITYYCNALNEAIS